MEDAAWAISALITVAFVVAAVLSTGGIAAGWWALAAGMAVVTVIRYRLSRRRPPP